MINSLLLKARNADFKPHKLQQTIQAELRNFPLGRHLLEHGHLNATWTEYLVHQAKNNDAITMSELERFIIYDAPVVRATQHRYLIFKRLCQSSLFEGIRSAAVPCGTMSTFYSLDFSKFNRFLLTGIDLDNNAIALAKNSAEKLNLQKHVRFIQSDAWQIKEKNSFDLLISNGLNIYIAEDKKVEELYKIFFDALAENGKLIVSALTSEEDWNIPQEGIEREKLKLQHLIFNDILNVKWNHLRSTKKTMSQLHKAGFLKIEVEHDELNMFPTYICTKTLT